MTQNQIRSKLQGYCDHYRLYDDPWPTIDDTNKVEVFKPFKLSDDGKYVYDVDGNPCFATRAFTSKYSSFFYEIDNNIVKLSCFGGDLVYVLKIT